MNIEMQVIELRELLLTGLPPRGGEFHMIASIYLPSNSFPFSFAIYTGSRNFIWREFPIFLVLSEDLQTKQFLQ